MLDEQVRTIDQKVTSFFDAIFCFIWSYIFHVLKYIIISAEGLLISIISIIYAFIPISRINPGRIQFKHFSHKE